MTELNEEQIHALDAMMSGKNVFLTGEAGTGKSTVLREFLNRCDRPCVVLAPTGVAAINVDGTTLHSFFLLKPGLLTEDTMDEIGKLMIVYGNQTGDEKSEGETKRENGVGFNKFDASDLTAIAEAYASQGWISAEQLREVSPRIQKYHAQWEGKV